MLTPREFFRPLVAGAPTPLVEIPRLPSRVLHCFDPSNDRMVDKLPVLSQRCDVLLANLEDGVSADRKVRARNRLINLPRTVEFDDWQLWVRINGLDTSLALDDLEAIVPALGDHRIVIVVPKVDRADEIMFVDRLLAQLEARAGLEHPLLVHALIETASGMTNVEAIAGASPRLQGLSLGSGDLAADRRMRATGVGGVNPEYLVREGPSDIDAQARRRTSKQDLWHYTLVRIVDACAANGIFAYNGPFGNTADPVGCEDAFRNAFILGCVGTWTLHPSQIDIANRVFTPSASDVAWAARVIASTESSNGSVLVDGLMQDEATVKQCRALIELAGIISTRTASIAVPRRSVLQSARSDGRN